MKVSTAIFSLQRRHIKMQIRNSLITLIIILTAATAFGQTQTGRLTDATQTFSFVPPSGWLAKAGDDDGFALVNEPKTIIMLVKAHNYTNFKAFSDDAGLAADGLELIGEPKAITNGNHFRTAKRMRNGIMVVDACVLFSEDGGGVIVTTLTDEANAAVGYNNCISVSSSVVFNKPKLSAAGDSPLSGKHLLYLYTGNGYSERKDIYLCASGAFYQSTGLGGFTPNDSDGASFGAMGKKHGTWSIVGTKLMLQFQNGGTTTYTISKRLASNEIGLNGSRYFVQTQNICQ